MSAVEELRRFQRMFGGLFAVVDEIAEYETVKAAVNAMQARLEAKTKETEIASARLDARVNAAQEAEVQARQTQARAERLVAEQTAQASAEAKEILAAARAKAASEAKAAKAKLADTEKQIADAAARLKAAEAEAVAAEARVKAANDELATIRAKLGA